MIFPAVLIFIRLILADQYEWTWSGGSRGPGGSGLYGTPGSSSKNYIPSARTYIASDYNEKDGLGFIFGGSYSFSGLGVTNTIVCVSDLWQFDSNNEEWTYLGGVSKGYDAGRYVNKGIESNESWPSARSYGNLVYNPTSNFLYLNGGYAFNAQNTELYNFDDFWIYNLTSGMWKWVLGNEPFIMPATHTDGLPPRSQMSCVYDKLTGSVYYYGGIKYGTSLNDFTINDSFWVLNTNTSNFTVVNNSMFLGNYPNKLTSSAGCLVPERTEFFIFGGYNYESKEVFRYNFIWSYNVLKKKWIQMFSLNIPNISGFYKKKFEPSIQSFPGSRRGHYQAYNSFDSTLLIFGGFGYGEQLSVVYLNDLWSYSWESSQWLFLGGSQLGNQDGKYAVKDVSSPNVFPGSRAAGATFFNRAKGLLYIFGGAKGDVNQIDAEIFNDFWQFELYEKIIITTKASSQIETSSKAFKYFTLAVAPSSSQATTQVSPAVVTIIISTLLLCTIIVLLFFRLKNDVRKLGQGEARLEGEDAYSHALEIAQNKRMSRIPKGAI